MVLQGIDFVRNLTAGIVVLSFVVLNSCKNETSKPSAEINSFQDTLTLVLIHCGRCHDVPDPSSLDRSTWDRTVLKNMGCRLGIQTDGYDPYRGLDMLEQSLLLQAAIYPLSPMIKPEQWQAILSYYRDKAPDSLSVSSDSSFSLSQFIPISKGDLIESPRVTTLFYDTIAREIHVGLESGRIYTLSESWNVKHEMNIGTTPIQYIRDDQDYPYILAVGVMYPSEQKNGSLIRLIDGQPVNVLTHLHRPVWMTRMDLNQDRKADFVISEFGYETGKLSWFDAVNPILSASNILFNGAGNIKTFNLDVNGDGIKDLVSLNAQGNEHVSAYLVDVHGNVEEKRLLQFPAIHGVCDLDIVDFNGDQRLDLVISNGDNADYTQITKPYHGIRIYLNQGNFNYEESVFIPYPGVLHTEISDFDQDGDLDIAAVSFFPGDPAYPFPGFKYFEQIAPGRFSGQTFKTSNQGKWMNMVKGDFDQDGDDDLLLGSFILNTNMVSGSREELKKNSLMFLENKKIK